MKSYFLLFFSNLFPSTSKTVEFNPLRPKIAKEKPNDKPNKLFHKVQAI